jgi:hypothetical protein
MPPQICPNCGARVPGKAKVCPECGSDDETGWSENAYEAPLDLPEEEFDYEKFVEREFEGKEPSSHRIHWFWWVVALLLATVFIWFWMRR